VEFAGKHLSTHDAFPRARAAVVGVITNRRHLQKSQWGLNDWRKRAGIQERHRSSTKMRFAAQKVAKKDCNLEKIAGEERAGFK
jgi:hypothetical protein